MRSIPGYHYDPEKKKYFKIQPGHTAQSGSKYSEAEVKRREKQFTKRKQKDVYHERTRLERVERAKILGLPIIGSLGVELETGRRKAPSRDTLNQRTIACASLMEPRQLVNLGYRGKHYCHQFARDPRTGIILTALKPTSTSNFSAFRPISPDRPWKYDEHVDKGIIELNHREWIIALSINHTGHVLIVSQDLFSGEGAHLAVGKLIEPSDAYGKSSRCAFETINALDSQASVQRLGKFHANISGLDWLNQDVVIVGLQNSTVALYDMRCKKSASRLTHSHGVQRLKMVNESGILVAGVDNTLDMYDLRFIKTPAKEQPNPNKRNHQPTTPYLRFGELNYRTLNDMDVSPHLGLVACATDLPRVQLFSLHTGKLLEPPTIPLESSRRSTDILFRDYMNPIDCVRFESITEPYEYGNSIVTTDDRNSASSVSLLVGSGKIIEEWAL
ncbi:hypothetical protein McanCB56680_002091 [Microsporum canis]